MESLAASLERLTVDETVKLFGYLSKDALNRINDCSSHELTDRDMSADYGFTVGGDPSGTCFQGEIHATYAKLVSVFGEPQHGPDSNDMDKVTCEWVITFNDGTIATIYDWKLDSTPRDKYGWHIGGTNYDAVLNVFGAIADA